jgi:hypothetical protein
MTENYTYGLKLGLWSEKLIKYSRSLGREAGGVGTYSY